jgi:hypothetical protein
MRTSVLNLKFAGLFIYPACERRHIIALFSGSAFDTTKAIAVQAYLREWLANFKIPTSYPISECIAAAVLGDVGACDLLIAELAEETPP